MFAIALLMQVQYYQPPPVYPQAPPGASQPRPWIPPAYPPGTLPGTMISPPPTYVLPPQPSPTQIWPQYR